MKKQTLDATVAACAQQEYWSIGALGHWGIGALGHWGIGALGHWLTGDLCGEESPRPLTSVR